MTQATSFAWAALSDDELLKIRFCDLGLKIDDSGLEPQNLQLQAELDAKGLLFRPYLYLSTEWQSPTDVVAIGIPFYLAHPRLAALEKKIMLEVEGGEPAYYLKLLRHEAGHCFDHAYGFSKRRKWTEVFGSPDEDYEVETYRPRAYSRSFVTHLDNWYAQAHPDEDFAETFAVWIDPSSDWKKRFKDWPGAIEKLKYVEQLGKGVAGKSVLYKTRPLVEPIARLKQTLGAHYEKRRKANAENYPDFYDRDLRSIFDGSAALSGSEFGAARFMIRNRKSIIEALNRWTGENKYTINGLVKKLTDRCAVLELRMGRSEAETNRDVAAYLAALVTNHLFTGKFKRSV